MASRIQKHYVVYRCVARAEVSWMRNMHARYTGRAGAPSLHVRACKAGGELTLSMHIPSGMGRPGHLGIKDQKSLFSVGASPPPERQRPG